MGGFWRSEDPIVATNGDIIRGGMFAHQRAWWYSDKFIRALVAGYGSGKTMISAKRAIAVSIQNAPAPYLYVSPSYKLAKRTIIPHIEALLDGKNVPYTYNKTDHEFLIYHAGRVGIIWIASGDDPKSLKGPNVGASNIDEPFIQDEAVFDQVIARVRDPRAKKREITLTGTPEALNWGYEICDGDRVDDYDLEVIHASTRDNVALPADYVDTMLRAYDSETASAYVDGQFVKVSQDAIYKMYSEENETDRVFKPGPILWTHDFNFMPMSSAIIQIDEKGAPNVVDEIVLEHADASDAAVEFVDRYGAFKNCPVVLYGDPSGRIGEKHAKVSNYIEIENTLRDAGFTVTRKVQLSTLSIRDGQNSLKGKIRNARGERSFFVNKKRAPTCHRALQTVKPIKGSSFIEDEKNTAQHIGTALRYFAHTEYPAQGRPEIRIS